MYASGVLILFESSGKVFKRVSHYFFYMMRKPVKPPEGARMKETADMVAWRKEFEKMKTSDHIEKLASLGLDDEDLEEFKEMKDNGVPLEKEILGEAEPTEEPAPKKKTKK